MEDADIVGGPLAKIPHARRTLYSRVKLGLNAINEGENNNQVPRVQVDVNVPSLPAWVLSLL